MDFYEFAAQHFIAKPFQIGNLFILVLALAVIHFAVRFYRAIKYFTGFSICIINFLAAYQESIRTMRNGRFLLAMASSNISRTTLHKYAYVGNDPTNQSDPSGLFGIGAAMSGISISFSLATTALTVVDLFQNADEIGDSLGLLGALIVASIGGPSGFEALASDPTIPAIILAAIGGPDKHHTIPVYMCGAKSQKYAHIDYADHTDIHAKLYAGVVGVNTLTRVLVNRYLKKPGKGGRQPSDPIVLLAKKRQGREFIATFLDYFYKVKLLC